MKINKESLTTSAVTVLSCTGGAMTSRVISEKLPFLKEEKQKLMKHGLLAGVSVAAMIFAPTKGLAGTMVQSALAGSAVIQVNEILKEVLKPQDGILKTALGNADGYDYSYDNSYDYYPELSDVSFSDPMALSGGQLVEEFPAF